LASRPTGFTEFLEQIIVDAQGVGSPYRLKAKPISSTLRVGVLAKSGELRMLHRSSVSGFEYNTANNAIAFFARSLNDDANKVSNDQKIIISYRTWVQDCVNDCAAGDVCAVCACTASRPECCASDGNPIFECRSPSCPLCGPCTQCNENTGACEAPSGAVGCVGCVGTCAQVGTARVCLPAGCPTGTEAVPVPCGEGCTPTTVVCVDRGPVGVSGMTCAGGDCCETGACSAGNLCVTVPCAGESCLPTAQCRPVGPTLCEPACATGQQCAPLGCGSESGCTPGFACLGPTQCVVDACGCSNDATRVLCQDCAVGSSCQANTCVPVCGGGESVAQCCAQPSNPCCPSGEQWNEALSQCSPGSSGCSPACPGGFICDYVSGRCIPPGG